MPTLGSQGDILQSKSGSHGDYVNIVLYPNSVEECFRYTIEALNAAEESLSPVILLSDGMLSHTYETVDLDSVKYSIKNRMRKPLGEEKRHFTGLLSKNDRPQTKDSQVYRDWYNERKKEVLDVANRYNFYEYMENKKADTLLIAFGYTSRVILPLKNKYSIFRPIRMFPVIKELKEIAKKYSKIIVVEMNDGQYRHELEAFLKRDIYSVTQLGGKISLKEIEDELSKIYSE